MSSQQLPTSDNVAVIHRLPDPPRHAVRLPAFHRGDRFAGKVLTRLSLGSLKADHRMHRASKKIG
jgi:hypothetical protein